MSHFGCLGLNLLIFYFLAEPHGMWNFPYWGLNPCCLQWKQSLNHWTTREVLNLLIFKMKVWVK